MLKTILNRAKALNSKVINAAIKGRENYRQATSNLRSNVIPLSVASKLGAAAIGAARGAKAALQIAQKIPLKARLGAAGLAATSAGLTHYASTGQIPLSSPRTTAGFLGMSLNPIAGTFGFLTGAGENIGKGLKNIYEKTPMSKASYFGDTPYTPVSPFMRGVNKVPEVYGNVVDSIPNIQFEMPSMPATSLGMPSLQMPGVNVTAGGGGNEAMLLALLAGAGLLGYGIGRKRKKKKYKKKRKRKK